MSNYGEQFMDCPQCGARVEAESVDVGVGLYIRDEWACGQCGWEMYGPLDFGFVDRDAREFVPPEAYQQ